MEPLERQLLNVASEAVYLNADVIKFLLAENLALKSLLHSKGLLTPEEFSKHKAKSMEILESSMKAKIVEEFKKTVERLDGKS